MIGKVGPETLASHVLGRTGARDESVIQGPAYGEDAAAIDLGDTVLVVSTDPISLAAKTAGTLGIHVACNDVAASGADPRWLTNVIFLPDDDPETLETIVDQMDTVATAIDVAIVGGHSEYLPELPRPLLSLTCFGTTKRFVPSGGATPGDAVILTKGAAIEGTAILASDFEAELRDLPDALLDRAKSMVDEISIIQDARILRREATAMHDPTEGGVLTGLVEMAIASGVGMEIDAEAIPIRSETRTICDRIGVDPLRIFGSGALLATVPPETVDAVIADLNASGIEAALIGRVHPSDEPGVLLEDSWYRSAVRDEMYPLWERQSTS